MEGLGLLMLVDWQCIAGWQMCVCLQLEQLNWVRALEPLCMLPCGRFRQVVGIAQPSAEPLLHTFPARRRACDGPGEARGAQGVHLSLQWGAGAQVCAAAH